MTYRERRERRAEQRREWAEGRAAKADASHEASRAATAGIPFGQPILAGHHSQRRHENALKRSQNAATAGLDHGRMATRHEEAADTIEAQLDRSIYSDDPDAIERLEEKLAKLEEARATMKRRNADWLKANRAAAKAMSAFERDRARPHAGYELTNLGGTVSRTKKRLEELRRNGGKPPVRTIAARRDGACARCPEPITAGTLISRIDGEWGHAECPGKE